MPPTTRHQFTVGSAARTAAGVENGPVLVVAEVGSVAVAVAAGAGADTAGFGVAVVLAGEDVERLRPELADGCVVARAGPPAAAVVRGPSRPRVGIGVRGTVVISNADRTSCCPGSIVHVTSTLPATVEPPLEFFGVRCTVSALPALIVAWPGRWKTTTGVLPVAPTVIEPDPGTAVRGTVSGAVTLMSPSGAVTTPIASTLPSTVAAPISLAASAAVAFTVAVASMGRTGVLWPTRTESGAAHLSRAVMVWSGKGGREQVYCNVTRAESAAAGPARHGPTLAATITATVTARAAIRANGLRRPGAW